jgi:hypothetical protein
MSHEKLLRAITKHLKEMTHEGVGSLIESESDIFDTAMELGIVDQDWLDNRLKATSEFCLSRFQVELFCELLYVIGLHHMKQTIQKSLQD